MLIPLLLAASVLDENAVRGLLKGPPRVVELPPGEVTVSSEIRVPAGFTLRGKTVLRASDGFRGRALLIAGSRVTIAGLTLDGNRAKLAKPVGIAPSDRTFVSYYDNNGIIAEKQSGVTLTDVTFRNIAGFAVIFSACDNVKIERAAVTDSGSLDAKGRNNTTGGILLEEGTKNFSVTSSSFRNVRGNGIWTHSLYTSPRNGPGEFSRNTFDTIGRDALQAGHATKITISGNTGSRIGWPKEVVDADPVAIDTAGNVDASVYSDNRFDGINGKCIDLDGFHHGRVTNNICTNVGHYGIVFNNTNPDMHSAGIQITGNTIDGAKYGGIFLIGSGHTVQRNRLLRLNEAHCGCVYDPKQPDILKAGIYVGNQAERPDPARDNTITDNVITGYGMQQNCVIPAPGVDPAKQTIRGNECRER